MPICREHFSDWFEPITGRETMSRRSSRRKKLHQKLVMSKMSAKKAAKLDMDDRAKIMQYFSRPVRGAGDVGKTTNVNLVILPRLWIAHTYLLKALGILVYYRTRAVLKLLPF